MGYYTRHSLEIVGGSNDLIAELRDFSEDAAYAVDENGDSSDSCKWYRHQDEMKAFSLKHPEVVFKLIGEGEENDDMWHEYYKNGKMQIVKAKIVFDEYCEDLLE